MKTRPSEGPRLLLFPPLLPLSALALGLLLQRLHPLGALAGIATTPRATLGSVLLVIGASVMLGAARSLRRAGTAVSPSRPVTTLVTQGVFGWTRNPIYLGGSLALVGFALAFALDWVLMLWAASLPLLHYGVVLREEAYLARQFGDAFRSYCAAVPRWLWPFG